MGISLKVAFATPKKAGKPATTATSATSITLRGDRVSSKHKGVKQVAEVADVARRQTDARPVFDIRNCPGWLADTVASEGRPYLDWLRGGPGNA